MCIRDRDSILGFSIDKYMGADYPLYNRFYYDYQCRNMEPDRIVPACFTFYLLNQYPLPWQPGRTLLDMIMHITGKTIRNNTIRLHTATLIVIIEAFI